MTLEATGPHSASFLAREDWHTAQDQAEARFWVEHGPAIREAADFIGKAPEWVDVLALYDRITDDLDAPREWDGFVRAALESYCPRLKAAFATYQQERAA